MSGDVLSAVAQSKKFSEVIVGRRAYIKKTETQNPDALLDNLTAFNTFDSEKTVTMLYENKDYYMLPRHYIKTWEDIADKVTYVLSDGQDINFSHNISLWDYQQTAFNQFNKIIKQGGLGIFLEAAPGAGKTQMAIAMIHAINKTTLVVVNKKDLIDQWVDRFLNNTDLKPEDIGKGQNGKVVWKDKKIVVALVHTLAKAKEEADFYRNFGMVVYDECDATVPPNTFEPVAGMFDARIRLGLTATADRLDGMDVVFHNHLVEYKILCEKANVLKPTVMIKEYDISSGEVSGGGDRIVKRAILMKNIASNTERNLMLAKVTVALSNLGKPTLVISDRKQHLVDIRTILIKELGVPENTIGFYVASLFDGKNRKEENKKTADKAMILLGTYGMIGRGTDIPRLEALVLATPRADLRQVKGRIERAMNGKGQPVILDIVDTCYQSLINSFINRREQYEKDNLEMIYV